MPIVDHLQNLMIAISIIMNYNGSQNSKSISIKGLGGEKTVGETRTFCNTGPRCLSLSCPAVAFFAVALADLRSPFEGVPLDSGTAVGSTSVLAVRMRLRLGAELGMIVAINKWWSGIPTASRYDGKP